MAGLDPAIHVLLSPRHLTATLGGRMGGWVYIMTNRPSGTL